MKNVRQIHNWLSIHPYILILTIFGLITAIISCSRDGGAGTGQEPVTAPLKHLFILSGQSNMTFLYTGAYFTPIVSDEFMGEVIVVKHAVIGSPIREWYNNGITGPEYETMMDKVDDAIEEQIIESVTFIWMQGEQDAVDGTGETYRDNLRGLIDQIRKDLVMPDINYVIGRLGLYGFTHPAYKDWEVIRTIQVEVANESEYGVWVDTDDCGDASVHYTLDGYKLLGKKFAEAAIELINDR